LSYNLNLGSYFAVKWTSCRCIQCFIWMYLL